MQSNDQAAAMDAANAQLKALAIGEAKGDASMGEYFATVAEHIGAGIREFADTGALYQWRHDVMNAEKTRLGRETADMPSGNSLASQLTKARTITQLGVYERTRTGTIAVFRSVAPVAKCAWKYKPLLVVAKAIAETLDDAPDATDECLRDAANLALDNMEVKPKTLEAELLKLAKAFDKLVASEAFAPTFRKAYDVHHIDARDTGKALARLINGVKAVEAAAALDA